MSDVETLLGRLVGEDEWSRHRALRRIQTHGASPGTLAALRDALEDDDATRRAGARMALAAAAHPASPSRSAARDVLRQALAAPDPDLRVLAASALGESGDETAIDDLVDALEDPDLNVQAAAADALGALRVVDALDPLIALARRSDFWVRSAAVVALGRIGDVRAVPALTALAAEQGLEKPIIEAVAAIGAPEGLETLAVVRAVVPEAALAAAGALLAANPDTPPPAWVRGAARAQEDVLRVRIAEHDDPAVARLLGVAATPSAVDTLVDLVGPPRRSEAALTGLLAVPASLRGDALMDRLPEAEAEERVALLSLLPPQVEEGRIRELARFLEAAEPAVRAAAAEALSRAPAARALPLFAFALDGPDLSPEVIRAAGGLGATACAALVPLLEDPSPGVRAAAAEALSRCGDPALAETLDAALDREDDATARRALLRTLGQAGGDRAVDRLGDALDSPDCATRLAALEGLGASGSPRAVPFLRPWLDGPTPEALAAIRALGQLDPAAAAPVLAPLLADPDLDRRRGAAHAAMAVAAELPARAVEPLVDDEDEWIRLCAVRILAGRGPDDRPRLNHMAAHDRSPAVRQEARHALGQEP